MSAGPTIPAALPPAGIIGLDPSWSRLVAAPDADGDSRTWHLLDTWASRPSGATPELTLLCVHGNPSWSFLWRDLLSQVEKYEPERVRVIAVDQLDMGFSERTGVRRTLAMRIEDLCRLTETLTVQGPVITVAHDWGGPISLGWALRHLQRYTSAARLAGVVLTNTAVHQPAGSPAPAVIRLVRTRLMLRPVTVYTGAFIQGTIEMSRPRLPAPVRAGFHAPYRDRTRRSAIADFVTDIPLDPDHESAIVLDEIAAGLAELTEIPALLLWGPRDKVFGDLYLHDLEARLPHADVHRFPNAAHFVAEDADVAGAVVAWLRRFNAGSSDSEPDSDVGCGMRGDNTQVEGQTGALAGKVPLKPYEGRALADFSLAHALTEAVVEIAPAQRSITFGELAERTEQLAAGMASFGMQPGDRVAVMVTPGVDLALAVYGCWRLGVTLVLVDSGLGRAGMQAALRSANPAWLIGIDKALVAAKVLRWPGKRIAVREQSGILTRMLGIVTDLNSLTNLGKSQTTKPLSGSLREPLLGPFPASDTVAAVVFTSGSTGPSKGVVYRHHQIQAQRDALMSLYDITAADRLVAAFAPFALYGPTMGITSIVPATDVSAPGTLTAQALVDTVERVDATLVFASPAALVNVVATRGTVRSSQRAGPSRGIATDDSAPSSACEAVRLVLSAGAPVRAELLTAASTIFKHADFHTPYGMTEMLPVADISLAELDANHSGDASGGAGAVEGAGVGEGVGEGEGEGASASASDGASALAGSAGVCVGHPLPTLDFVIDPLDEYGKPSGGAIAILPSEPGILGEILVRAPHARDGYDRLWLTDHHASQPEGWHRTGDIGQRDATGRLWVGGRLGHVITSPAGPVAPVSSERRIERLDDITMAAVVGVGPTGTQAIVAVVQIPPDEHPTGEASLGLLDQIRHAVDDRLDVVAALVVRKLPVDRRHNSKVDRTAVAHWAARTLAGERVASL